MMSMSSNKELLKDAVDVLTIHMKDQIIRLSEKRTSVKRKRPFDDITNAGSRESAAVDSSATNTDDMDDPTVLQEIDLLLGFTHTLKRWNLGILQKSSDKDNAKEDYLACKVIKKGVTDAENHAIRVLYHVESYSLKRLELALSSSTSSQEYLDQKIKTIKTIDMIYMIRTRHMMKEIITIYTEFYDIALKLSRTK